MTNETLDVVRKKIMKKYYPNGLPTLNDFKEGDRVKVIVPMQDFHFFNGDTGFVKEIKGDYLGIIVKFDRPRLFDDGSTQEEFNFNPSDLFKISDGVEENKRRSRKMGYFTVEICRLCGRKYRVYQHEVRGDPTVCKKCEAETDLEDYEEST